jgi:hypothetical protein
MIYDGREREQVIINNRFFTPMKGQLPDPPVAILIMMNFSFTTCPMVLRNRYLKSRNKRLTALKIPDPLGYEIILAG